MVPNQRAAPKSQPNVGGTSAHDRDRSAQLLLGTAERPSIVPERERLVQVDDLRVDAAARFHDPDVAEAVPSSL